MADNMDMPQFSDCNNAECNNDEITKQKSKYIAGILQLLCGCFGVGRFYLGDKQYAVFQILASLISCGVAGVIWGFLDGIQILNGNVMYDGYGNPLK